jgi:hypothetical protein
MQKLSAQSLAPKNSTRSPARFTTVWPSSSSDRGYGPNITLMSALFGPDTVYYATQLRGASNEKAKRELNFRARRLERLEPTQSNTDT